MVGPDVLRPSLMEPEREQAKWFVDEVLPHERDVRAWLARRFPDVSDIDDVMQDAFARCLKATAAGPVANPRAFLFVTARNLALNHLRRRRYERPPGRQEEDAMTIVDELTGPQESVAKREELQHLIRAIQSLPRRCRQVMTLRKIYGFSQQEVADRLGISVHTVEAQSSIGLRKCIEFFRRSGYLTGSDS